MVTKLIWICAIVVVLAASVQSQAQKNAVSQNTTKPSVPNECKYKQKIRNIFYAVYVKENFVTSKVHFF